MNEQEIDSQEQGEQKPQDEWSKYFPEPKEKDLRYDIKVKLENLQMRNRISDGVDIEQLVDFIIWLHTFKDESPIRYTSMSPYEYFLQLLAQRIA